MLLQKIIRTLNLAVIFICAPLSLLLLFFWLAFAGGLFLYSDFQDVLKQLYVALFVSVNIDLAVHIARELLSAFGGLLGWVSLIALGVSSFKRPRSGVSPWVKLGCFIGICAALATPAAPGVALPPVLLCMSLLWFAAKREHQPIAQGRV